MGSDLCPKEVKTLEQARKYAEDDFGAHVLCLPNSKGDQLWVATQEPDGFMIHVCFIYRFQGVEWAFKWVYECAGPMSVDCPDGIRYLVRGTKPREGESAEWRKAVGI